MAVKNSCIDQNKIMAEETDYLFISVSQIANSGNGLFTAIEIYKDEIISFFKGEILSANEIKTREEANNDKYFMNLPNGNVLDCMHTKCFAKYANDATGFAKSDFNNNCKITLDDAENVCIIATKNIKSGEEIFCSYGKRYWKRHKKTLQS